MNLGLISGTTSRLCLHNIIEIMLHTKGSGAGNDPCSADGKCLNSRLLPEEDPVPHKVPTGFGGLGGLGRLGGLRGLRGFGGLRGLGRFSGILGLTVAEPAIQQAANQIAQPIVGSGVGILIAADSALSVGVGMAGSFQEDGVLLTAAVFTGVILEAVQFTGGRFRLLQNHIVAMGFHIIIHIAVTASTGVGGVASLCTCGSSYNCLVLMSVQSLQGLCRYT